MRKIIAIVLTVMVVLNVAVLASSFKKKPEAEMEAGMSGSVKIEVKEFNALFFISLLKF